MQISNKLFSHKNIQQSYNREITSKLHLKILIHKNLTNMGGIKIDGFFENHSMWHIKMGYIKIVSAFCALIERRLWQKSYLHKLLNNFFTDM